MNRKCKTRKELLEQSDWRAGAVAGALAVTLSKAFASSEWVGAETSLFLGPLAVTFLLCSADESAKKLTSRSSAGDWAEAVGAIAVVGVLYGLLCLAAVMLIVLPLPLLFGLQLEVSTSVLSRIFGLATLIPPLIVFYRLPRH